ncbi:MAG TPA: hypothetical protein VGE07_30560 [Herpetosiphonaceae bacterium]
MKKTPLILLGAGWLIFMLAATACLSLAHDDMPPQRFVAETWQNHDTDSGENPRLNMLADLRRRHLSAGLPRAAALELLGPPDEEPATDTISYYLGREGALAPQPVFLDLVFDDQQALARTETRPGR